MLFIKSKDLFLLKIKPIFNLEIDLIGISTTIDFKNESEEENSEEISKESRRKELMSIFKKI